MVLQYLIHRFQEILFHMEPFLLHFLNLQKKSYYKAEKEFSTSVWDRCQTILMRNLGNY